METQKEYSEKDLKKWLSDTRERREHAREIFEQEQRELAEREAEEAAERDRQAEEEEEGGNDQRCELCGEKEDRPDDDVILLCDFKGCLGASHLGCCEPPLQDVPEGDVSISIRSWQQFYRGTQETGQHLCESSAPL